MTDIKLDWENNMEGPLPTSVEILRDNVVIHTENGNITTYTDTIDDESIFVVTYNVRNINGQYSEISDPLVVAVGGWSVFFPLTIDEYDVINNGELRLFPILSGGFNETSFTSLGFNPEYSGGASYSNVQYYPPSNLQGSEYTISFKIKAPPQQNYVGILEWDSPGLATNVRCEYTNNTIYMTHMGQFIESTINVFDDIEHRIDIVRKDNTFFFYIDGVLDTSTPIESADLTSGLVGPLYVGYRSNVGTFNGYIKDLGFSPLPLYG